MAGTRAIVPYAMPADRRVRRRIGDRRDDAPAVAVPIRAADDDRTIDEHGLRPGTNVPERELRCDLLTTTVHHQRARSSHAQRRELHAWRIRHEGALGPAREVARAKRPARAGLGVPQHQAVGRNPFRPRRAVQLSSERSGPRRHRIGDRDAIRAVGPDTEDAAIGGVHAEALRRAVVHVVTVHRPQGTPLHVRVVLRREPPRATGPQVDDREPGPAGRKDRDDQRAAIGPHPPGDGIAGELHEVHRRAAGNRHREDDVALPDTRSPIEQERRSNRSP
ncbi:MAG: hypothetical protein AUH85_17610 [Chloroflexi bacterium 13_1_40CM_4_68_4]|nr:MAG: hypothetical protein AUH85_17610 [Chloroflexi bacterium 13_1_40CM_4_68_4]